MRGGVWVCQPRCGRSSTSNEPATILAKLAKSLPKKRFHPSSGPQAIGLASVKKFDIFNSMADLGDGLLQTATLAAIS